MSSNFKGTDKARCRLETDLVAKTLRGNNSDLIANPLVGFKVECEFGVVALDNDLRGFLNGLWNF